MATFQVSEFGVRTLSHGQVQFAINQVPQPPDPVLDTSFYQVSNISRNASSKGHITATLLDTSGNKLGSVSGAPGTNVNLVIQTDSADGGSYPLGWSESANTGFFTMDAALFATHFASGTARFIYSLTGKMDLTASTLETARVEGANTNISQIIEYNNNGTLEADFPFTMQNYTA